MNKYRATFKRIGINGIFEFYHDFIAETEVDAQDMAINYAIKEKELTAFYKLQKINAQ